MCVDTPYKTPIDETAQFATTGMEYIKKKKKATRQNLANRNGMGATGTYLWTENSPLETVKPPPKNTCRCHGELGIRVIGKRSVRGKK